MDYEKIALIVTRVVTLWGALFGFSGFLLLFIMGIQNTPIVVLVLLVSIIFSGASKFIARSITVDL
jgi:uncharacterized integral membrane protein